MQENTNQKKLRIWTSLSVLVIWAVFMDSRKKDKHDRSKIKQNVSPKFYTSFANFYHLVSSQLEFLHENKKLHKK